ncbi:MAG: twin-arginine translocation signal domain-containing protein, partial [bacterium]|nr:twin-arginine translocation signal domain-containing protein [bacterium]
MEEKAKHQQVSEKRELPDHDGSELSRRDFIKIGAATLAVSVIGGGLFKFLLRSPKKFASVKASPE